MAVGDIIIGGSADNTALTFQPAASVVILISAVGLNDNGSAWLDVTDGALITHVGNKASVNPNNQQNMKVFIDNTHYLSLIALGVGKWSTYHGVQTE